MVVLNIKKCDCDSFIFQHLNKRVKFIRDVVHEVCGFAPYEKRALELLKINKDKRALKFVKKRVRSCEINQKTLWLLHSTDEYSTVSSPTPHVPASFQANVIGMLCNFVIFFHKASQRWLCLNLSICTRKLIFRMPINLPSSIFFVSVFLPRHGFFA